MERQLMRRRTVLLVEDNQLLRWWMTSGLEREGWSVLTSNSADEAIKMAATAAFQVLITDWRLADDQDGFGVLAQVRAKYPQVLAILISADADAELTGRAQTNGFDVVLRKPFPLAEIMGAVHGLAASQPSEGTS